jgi:hypothetical protein
MVRERIKGVNLKKNVELFLYFSSVENHWLFEVVTSKKVN